MLMWASSFTRMGFIHGDLVDSLRRAYGPKEIGALPSMCFKSDLLLLALVFGYAVGFGRKMFLAEVTSKRSISDHLSGLVTIASAIEAVYQNSNIHRPDHQAAESFSNA